MRAWTAVSTFMIAGCISKGTEIPPITGGNGLTVDSATQTISIDSNRVPLISDCGPNQLIVKNAAGTFACASSAPAADNAANATQLGGTPASSFQTTAQADAKYALLPVLGWTKTVALTTGPPVRGCCSSITFDHKGGALFFGGRDSQNHNDTWRLSNATGSAGLPFWTQIAASNPPPGRGNHVAAYDPTTDALIVFGGCHGNCLPVGNDTFVLQNAHGVGGSPAWTQLPIVGPRPPPRQSVASAYDPETSRLMIYGGQDGSAACNGAHAFNDAWVLSNANGTGSPQWTQLNINSASPRGKCGVFGAYNPRSNRFIAFSGGIGDGIGGSNAVWALTNANNPSTGHEWVNVIEEDAPGAPPPTEYLGYSGYDPLTNRLFVYALGTFDRGWALFNADGTEATAPSWRSFTLANPPTAGGFATTFNPAGRAFVVLLGAGPFDLWRLQL